MLSKEEIFDILYSKANERLEESKMAVYTASGGKLQKVMKTIKKGAVKAKDKLSAMKAIRTKKKTGALRKATKKAKKTNKKFGTKVSNMNANKDTSKTRRQ